MKLTLPVSSLLIAAVLTLSACGSLPKISMPNVSLPFMGGGEVPPPADDPLVPFDPHKALTYGHTLKLVVYRGARNPSKFFAGSVMVDHEGLVTFKDAGQVKLGGLTVPKAARAIESAFMRDHGDAIVQVQIERVEEMPLIMVTGAVRSPSAVQWFEGLTVTSALSSAGGHDGSSGRAVYVIHEGVRQFHASADDTLLTPGDIVNFSSDL